MQDYGKRLREARKAKGLTQIQAAALCNLEQPNYQRIESGKSDIKISMLYKVCQGLDVSADYVLGIEVDPVVAKAKGIQVSKAKPTIKITEGIPKKVK